jgi:hypothetical protein
MLVEGIKGSELFSELMDIAFPDERPGMLAPKDLLVAFTFERWVLTIPVALIDVRIRPSGGEVG